MHQNAVSWGNGLIDQPVAFNYLAFKVTDIFYFNFINSLYNMAKFKGGPSQILGRNFTKNTKKSSVYSQRLLLFIHKTPVVKNHPTTRKIRQLLRPRSTPTGIMVYFYMSSSLIYILQIHRRTFQTLHLMNTLWKMITCLL